MPRHLPVLRADDRAAPGRSRPRWIAIGGGLVVLLWVPLVALAGSLGLGSPAVALGGFAAAAAAAGAIVRATGGVARRDAAISGAAAGALLALVALLGTGTPWTVGAAALVLVPTGAALAWVGALGRAREAG